ncbi:MAG TPA: hypothetical protein V6D23_02730, partial [Candidatus Obscuribacterales bacterium]
ADPKTPLKAPDMPRPKQTKKQSVLKGMRFLNGMSRMSVLNARRPKRDEQGRKQAKVQSGDKGQIHAAACFAFVAIAVLVTDGLACQSE